MRSCRQLIIIIALLISCSLYATDAHAATINAASASYADVNAAVASASSGDKVIVPTGSSTWSSTLSITKGITLQGAGIGNTIITSNSGGVLIAIAPDATTIANDGTIRVTDFTLDGNNAALKLITVTGAGASAAKAFKNLAIGNNQLRNASTTTSGSGAISITGQVRGVIYNNTFDRVNVVAKILGNDDTTEWANGHFPFAYGSVDNLYFEDNTIRFSSSYSGQDPGWVETGQGARIAVRYNTWNLANATQQELWDIHGFQNWPANGQTGTMVVEYYGNTCTNCTGYRWVNHRGSWGLFHNNNLTGSGRMSIEVNQYYPGVPGGSGCTADVPGASGVYTTEVNNTYVWNNTQGGIAKDIVPGIIGNGCGISVNNGYWNYSVACTSLACLAGVGRGTTAPTGTCTVGTAYWVASTPTPTTSSSVIQAGTLYKCLTTNVWTPYYTPFTYPHPLRAVTAPPSVPLNLRVQ